MVLAGYTGFLHPLLLAKQDWRLSGNNRDSPWPSDYNAWLPSMSLQFLVSARGPHRYDRTVRVPIQRRKIPVSNRIKSSRYFFTGTMKKMPLCWYSRQGGKECRDAGSAGKYIAIASSSGGRHFNCTTIVTNALSSTWKSVKRATLCILHGASPAPPHFSKH